MVDETERFNSPDRIIGQLWWYIRRMEAVEFSDVLFLVPAEK
jgi:hypothetical protein